MSTYVYLVTHTMTGDKKAVVWVCKNEERARRCCEVIASDHGKRETQHVWNDNGTKYYDTRWPNQNFFEIQRWEVD